jgi:hypothetical protein
MSVSIMDISIMGISGNRQQWIGVAAILVALLVGVAVYASWEGPRDGRASDGGSNESEKAVELVSHEGELEDGRPARVRGIVRNTSDRTLSRVNVEVGFYNAAGSQTGDTTTQTSGLGPGKEWQFEVPVRRDSVSRYEIDQVTWR